MFFFFQYWGFAYFIKYSAYTVYLSLRFNSNSNMTSFFRFVNKRAICRLGIISFAQCSGTCDWHSRRKCTCWWIIVCSNLAA